MTTTHHLSQSVTGPLRNWTRREWQNATKWITRKDGSPFTADELKAAFQRHADQGHEVIPIGDCDNFDWKEGCKGHPHPEDCPCDLCSRTKAPNH